MEKNKLAFLCSLIAAVLAYIVSAVYFTRSDSSLGAAWICIGTCFMIVSIIWRRRMEKAKDPNKKENSTK